MKKNGITKKPQAVTEMKKFKPNHQQMRWLNGAIESQTGTISGISDHCGIDRKQWYRWLEIEGFEDWYYEEYDKKIRTWKPHVDALGWRFANRGSDKHFEYLAKRVGNIKDDKGDINIDNRQIHVIALPERKPIDSEAENNYNSSDDTKL